MTPSDAVRRLALAHQHLGVVYHAARDFDRAQHHYSESIRLYEAQGDIYGAAQSRYDAALALANAGRPADARQYAEAALRGYQIYGSGAAEGVEHTLALIAIIAKAATP